MKKLIVCSILSFLLGLTASLFLSGFFAEKTLDIIAAIQLPANISSTAKTIELIDEGKLDAVRQRHVWKLRCDIEEYEKRYKNNNKFTSSESVKETKARYFKYTDGLGCHDNVM